MRMRSFNANGKVVCAYTAAPSWVPLVEMACLSSSASLVPAGTVTVFGLPAAGGAASVEAAGVELAIGVLGEPSCGGLFCCEALSGFCGGACWGEGGAV